MKSRAYNYMRTFFPAKTQCFLSIGVHVVSVSADVFVSLCLDAQEYPASRKQKTDKLYFSIIITPLGFVCQRYFFLNLAPIKSLFYAVCWIYISCALDIYALRVGYISPVRWTYISCMNGNYTLYASIVSISARLCCARLLAHILL